jgi:fimbrial chaperone protein
VLPVGASTFSVDRTDVRLSAKAQTALITLKNDGDSEIRFQLAAFTWGQDQTGEFKLAATQDVVVFPTLLTLAKGESRQIRVGTTAAFGAVEKTYRVFIEELPSAAAPKPGAGVSMRTKIGIPVFLEPTAPPQAAVAISDPAVQAGAVTIPVRNTGNVHVVADNIPIRGLDAQGRQVFSDSARGGYILAGDTRAFQLRLTPEQCRSAQAIEAAVTVDGKTTNKRATVAAGGCTGGR